ncbi:MAG: DUF3047 domain-containing protein [Candidatus Auribacterota bacterium]|nr:DUF3047 domain-containing protein [Candidatus Auribacterota bacterium]
MTKWMFVSAMTLIWQLACSDIDLTFSNAGQGDISLRFGSSLEEMLKQWQIKSLVGKDEYQFIKKEKGNVLHIFSKNSANILLKQVEFNPHEYQLIRWHWMVNKFPEYSSEGATDSIDSIDDYAARLCVVFPSWSIWTTKFLVYVWDDRAADTDTVKPSSFSKNCKLLVVENGTKNRGKWVTEERNIIEDYRKVFGSNPPKKAGAIGIMSDSDDTRTSTDACYYNIYLKSTL